MVVHHKTPDFQLVNLMDRGKPVRIFQKEGIFRGKPFNTHAAAFFMRTFAVLVPVCAYFFIFRYRYNRFSCNCFPFFVGDFLNFRGIAFRADKPILIPKTPLTTFVFLFQKVFFFFSFFHQCATIAAFPQTVANISNNA